MTATYEIRTVLDFLKVPAERRDECLREFAIFLKIVEPSVALLGAVADETVGKDAVAFTPIDLYRWIDDDRNAVGMYVVLPDGSRQEVFDITPDDAERIGASLDSIAGSHGLDKEGTT